MLEKTIDLIEKYVKLREFQIKDNNHNFVNEAIMFLENKILNEMTMEKERQQEQERKAQRIKLKQEKRKEELIHEI